MYHLAPKLLLVSSELKKEELTIKQIKSQLGMKFDIVYIDANMDVATGSANLRSDPRTCGDTVSRYFAAGADDIEWGRQSEPQIKRITQMTQIGGRQSEPQITPDDTEWGKAV